ncbi:anti-sigma factor [Sphingorhabdus contaminans]|uniref:Anti-sigma K factor RskA C-terminal domain-containing protein n=1 Tax=Sphingorhabdus contaminans TaxID=1343899 RepID=A0A553WIK7_9SPHN|nr:anti-sigma factor [Sphingorhabdus contaminans]TSB04518.1 hypothetical protein FOM92_03605 [Sphingorhabdus contaminans]
MIQPTEEDIALAGEYVLGLLDVAGNAMAEARIATDAAFAKEVEAWRVRLQPMLAGDVDPPDRLWDSIEKSIPPVAIQDLGLGKLAFWRTLTGMSVSAAVILGILFLQKPGIESAPTPAKPLIAALSNENRTTSLTASYDEISGRLIVLPVSLDTGKLYPELWIIPADGKARSLGIVDKSSPTAVIIPNDMREFLVSGGTLAITPERAGGAPDGKATGPVIASGKIARL